jgi:16S rRNA U1498 N3-methylase RsmE
MSETLTKLVVNCETGQEEIIPLTAEEVADLEQNRLAFIQEQEAEQAEAVAKEALRQSGINKLMALGLTEEEANALVK